jgi:murein DD-endopeptidase MepM/ murein hydrolase activator NlpD
MQLKFFLQTLCACISLCATAQPPLYPKNYFRNPVDIPMQIQANMGELRNDHWHMGLDIRTNAKENYPVYAAAGGYIAYVGVRPNSFGRFIIINHPNGLSTLYAHLNDFFPELEKAVRAKQAMDESWPVEWKIGPGIFNVVKGDFIAYSGNTGGSQGPHLHFEIIDTKTEKRLNPLLFGFPLQDNIPPSILKLAMYDRSRSTHDQTPVFFTLKKTDSGYILPKNPVINTGLQKVSFAIQAVDRMNSSGSDDGIYSAMLSLDSIPQVKFVIDSISYDETRYMNAQIDYKMRYNGGGWLQHVARLPGDFGGVYKPLAGDGVVMLNDTLPHLITIDVKDAAGNASHLDFYIRHYDSLATGSYYSNSPVFIPGQENVVRKPEFEAQLPVKCIYDTVPVLYANTGYKGYNTVTGLYSIGNSAYPVQDPITIRLKQSSDISKEQRSKLVMIRTDRKATQIKKAEWDNGWITAKFADFGSFQACVDLSPPSVNSLGNADTINLSSASRIVFTPTDNYKVGGLWVYLYSCMSDSSGYHCTSDSLSGKKWLRFTNDKSRNWIYRFDENCPYGVHKLQVIVEDITGNTTTKEWWIKRYPYTPPPPKKKVVKKQAEKTKKDAKKKTESTKKTSAAKKPAIKKKK